MMSQAAWKKWTVFLTALMLLLALAGCGASEETPAARTPDEDAQAITEPDRSGEAPADETADPTAGQDEIAPTEPLIEEAAAAVAARAEPSPEPSADSDQAESEESPAPAAAETPTPQSPSTETEEDAAALTTETGEDAAALTASQRNSINMLNYMSALTQRINEQRKNQLFLETAYTSFDNLYPGSVDEKTQEQIAGLMDTIQSYRMIDAKRDRLEYIYEQNQAQAMRQAVPDSRAMYNALLSGSQIKALASVLYLAVDSVTSYQGAIAEADLAFVEDGWELDDAESAALHESTVKALNYLLDMVRSYDLPGDYALSREAIEDYVLWSGKPESQLVRKIAWFESHAELYREFGPYWLELAEDYYNNKDYEKCLSALRQYEAVSTRIFRKDTEYAAILPMAILSARETMSEAEYIEFAGQCCALIIANTRDGDWALRYFTAQTYLNLYALSDDGEWLDKAYKIAFDNVVVLVDKQHELNAAYLSELQEEEAGKDATKREKKEIKQYNKRIKEERKTALPPVYEALYLNCDLLIELAAERNISDSEKSRIDAILHENGSNLFLTEALDTRFRLVGENAGLRAEELEISFDGGKLEVPAACFCEHSEVVVTVAGSGGTVRIDDWTVKEVKRPKNADFSEFTVVLESETGKDYSYQDGDTVTIRVIPLKEAYDGVLVFTYQVTAVKKALVFNGVSFERIL